MKVSTHHRDVTKRIKDIDLWKVDNRDKNDVRDFLKAYGVGEITGRIGTNVNATLERVCEYLKPCFVYINKKKPVCDLTKSDKEIMQDFLSAIMKDIIKTKDKKPYSIKTKKFMIHNFVNYLKWKFPDDHLTFTKVLSIRIQNKLPEPEFLKEEEIDKLYKNCSNSAERFLIAVLFSSGMRAEEYHNLRYQDIEMPKDKEMFVKIRVNNQYSKTKGRTISLYYKYSLEAVKDYLEERINQGIKPDDPVFNQIYDTTRQWLRALGERVLNKRIHYHLFRSSCATWMTDKLSTKAEYCYFFGWNFSSPMPDVYISRKGVEMKNIDQKFSSTQLEQLKALLEKEAFERKRDRERFEKMLSKFAKSQGFEETEPGHFINKKSPHYSKLKQGWRPGQGKPLIDDIKPSPDNK